MSEAAKNVTFATVQTEEAIQCLTAMTQEQRLQKTLLNGNNDEAVRIQIAIQKSTKMGTTADAAADALKKHVSDVCGEVKDMQCALVFFVVHVRNSFVWRVACDRYLGNNKVDPNRFAERRIFAQSADQPPFTDLTCEGVSAFKARLLEQAAVDNYASVVAFVTDPQTVTVKQLEALFTSCFMYECLRDELFIAIFKTGSTDGNTDALLQLALGHFGPSAELEDFVKAFVLSRNARPELCLNELLVRRTYVLLQRGCQVRRCFSVE